MTLHEIEDRARGVDLDSPLGRALQRMYARKLNQLWQGKVTPAEIHEHATRRIHRCTGPDYFRARTIARNAINTLQGELLGLHDRKRYRRGQDAPTPEAIGALAVTAARAVRRIRPEIFHPGRYAGIGPIDA